MDIETYIAYCYARMRLYGSHIYFVLKGVMQRNIAYSSRGCQISFQYAAIQVSNLLDRNVMLPAQLMGTRNLKF